MKKVIAILGSAVMLATSVAGLASCGETKDEKKVMNVSVNPSVEFVLNGDDKVVSVNALNEEGNLIVSAEAFTGKSAEAAAKLFIEVSKETGFLVEANATIKNNDINISISGDATEAKKLYDDVCVKVNEYLSAENVEAKIAEFKAISEEQLEALVAECAPYMEAAEVKALEYMELVETLYESRKETAEMYSQELKNAYYDAKAHMLQQVEFETLKTKVNELAQAGLDLAYTSYATAVESIEETRMEKLVSEDSDYQKALAEFRAAKIAYLNYRAEVAAMEQTAQTEAVLNALNAYESVVDLKEQALVSAGELANAALDSAKANVTALYNTVVGVIEKASVAINQHLEEISANQKAKMQAFFTEFETAYAESITKAEQGWADMKTQLENKTQPAA